MDHQSSYGGESSNEDNREGVVKLDVQSSAPAEKSNASSSQETSHTNENQTLNVQEKDNAHLSHSGNHGDNNGQTSTEPPIDKVDDGRRQEKTVVTGADDNAPENITSTFLKEEELAGGTPQNVETIGPTNKEKPKHLLPETDGSYRGSAPAEKSNTSSSQETSHTNENQTLNVQEKDNAHLPHSGNHGDNNGQTSTELPIDKVDINTETAASTMDNTTDNQGDRSNTRPFDGSTDIQDRSTRTGKDDGRRQEKTAVAGADNNAPENITSTFHKEKELAGRTPQNVEAIGPTNKEKPKHPLPETDGSYRGKGILPTIIIPVLAAILIWYFLHQPESPPPRKLQQIDLFIRQMEKVKSQFPNQRSELWKRSRIHLERHLNTTHPTEPVSLILTAGLRAKRTLQCLAQGLASTFSSALNASILHIDGASKASQDSDQVKLDIDSQLQRAFEGDKPVAVIHRFEELPPGSTLIFYRYCDHENAAYKKTFLIFTVLLEEEEEIPAKINLSAVEEMVDDHLQRKFLSHGQPMSFDMMDLDKYGGLWSRISHLILPVAAEKRIEDEGC